MTSKSWSIPKSWSKYTTLVGFSRQLCQKFIETKGKCFDKRLPYQFHCRYRQVAISQPCTTRRLQHRRLRCSKSLSTLYHCCHVSHVALFLHPENKKIVSNCILILHLCYSTITCKVLLNWPNGKLGQYCADSLPNLDEHITRLCESIALLLRNAPSF